MPTTNLVVSNLVEAMDAVENGAHTVFVSPAYGEFFMKNKCIVCGKEMNHIESMEICDNVNVCSVECGEFYDNNSRHFFDTVFEDDNKLGEWIKGASKEDIDAMREKGTYREEIMRRLESI